MTAIAPSSDKIAGRLEFSKQSRAKGAHTQSKPLLVYGIHWHVLTTHFPISFFMISAIFMAVHLFTDTPCYEKAAFLCLTAGAIVAVPTTATGWITWKKKYKGARTPIFLKKIKLSGVIVALSSSLVLWRWFYPSQAHTVWHYVYLLGIGLLFLCVELEGFYGGRLNHR
jgi:uncharacterized membrane protein